MSEENQIYIVVEEPVTESAEDVEGTRGGSVDVGGGWGTPTSRIINPPKRQRVGMKVSDLKSQMQDLLGVVNDLFDPAQPDPAMTSASGLQLEEVSLAVEVNAEGQLSILGTGGKMGGSGGITLKFARPKP